MISMTGHTIANFQQVKGLSLEIYQMAGAVRPWDMLGVERRSDKKAQAEARARLIYARLMDMRPESLSNNDWAKRAGVNTSFFTALKGGPGKPPSEPSIGNLRAVLEAAGSSIPEFFIHEAKGRVGPRPTAQALEQAIEAALPDMPRRPDRRPHYFAGVVAPLLALPPDRFAIPEDRDTDDREAGAPAHSTTKKA